MTDNSRHRIRIAVSIALLAIQAWIFSHLGANKTSEVLFMLLAFVACSEIRIYIQKLALLKEEELLTVEGKKRKKTVYEEN